MQLANKFNFIFRGQGPYSIVVIAARYVLDDPWNGLLRRKEIFSSPQPFKLALISTYPLRP